MTELVGAGLVSVPVWRGDRQFFVRRTADQEHAVLLVIEADGTERTLIDPMADRPRRAPPRSTPGSRAKRVTSWRTSSPRAAPKSRCCACWMSPPANIVDGPIDRARYSPIAWLPGGERYYYVRRLAADLVPAGEEQFHRRVWLHRLGTDPADDTLIFGEGLDPTNYYGVASVIDGRWMSIAASAGTEPRNDLWVADLDASSVESPELITVQTGWMHRPRLHFGRDGRHLHLHRPGRPSRSDRGDRAGRRGRQRRGGTGSRRRRGRARRLGGSRRRRT